MPTLCANRAPYGQPSDGGRILIDPTVRRRSDAGAGAVKAHAGLTRHVIDADGTVQPFAAVARMGTGPFTIYTTAPGSPVNFSAMVADAGVTGVAFSGTASGRMTGLAAAFADAYDLPRYQVVLDRTGAMRAVPRGGGRLPAAVMVVDPAGDGEPTLHVLPAGSPVRGAVRAFMRDRVLRRASADQGRLHAPPATLAAGRRERARLAVDGGLGRDSRHAQLRDLDRGGYRVLRAAHRIDQVIEPVEKWAAGIGLAALAGAGAWAGAHGLPPGHLELSVSGIAQPAQELVRAASSFFQDVLMSTSVSTAFSSVVNRLMVTAPDARGPRRRLAATATFLALTALDPPGLIEGPSVIPDKAILFATGAVGAISSLLVADRDSNRAGRVRSTRLTDARVRYLRPTLASPAESVEAGMRMFVAAQAERGGMPYDPQTLADQRAALARWAQQEPFKARYVEFVAAQLGLPVREPAVAATAIKRSRALAGRDHALRDRHGGKLAPATA